LLLEERFAGLWVGFHGWFTRSPFGRTNLSVLLEELQRIDHTQCFIDATAQWQVVYNLVSHHPLFVN
jgi:hypothetical protein